MLRVEAERAGEVLAHHLPLVDGDVVHHVAGRGGQRKYDRSGQEVDQSLGGQVAPVDGELTAPLR